MRWLYLGHAMWLAEVGDLRILFDPQLDDTHHGGLFEINPRRTIDIAGLRADFIVVSHRHPDHFNIATLKRLADADADSVVITSDAMIERSAKRLGFRSVTTVDALHTIELTDATLLTTPSYGSETEWGVMVATKDGVAWNQIDTVLRDVNDVQTTLAQAAAAFEQPRLKDGIELGLVQWQPLLEINHTLARNIGFPTAEYGRTLEKVSALHANAIVPASAGARHVGPYAWLNQTVYPVPERRFLRDVGVRCPQVSRFPGRIGDTFIVADKQVHRQRGLAVDWLEVDASPDSCTFIPFEIPALTDPNLDDRAEDELRTKSASWVMGPLKDGLTKAFPDMAAPSPLTLVLSVVTPSTTDHYTFTLTGEGTTVERRFDDDYDVLNAIAASQLLDVIEAKKHWGTPLLGGMIRASRRSYAVTVDGLTNTHVGVIFLYYALSYNRANERWIDRQLAELD